MSRRIRTISNKFNANSFNMLATGDISRTKSIAKYSLIGMCVGAGFSLFTRRSVMLGLLVGTLTGMGVGTFVENIKKK